jgi:tetratricopeptide (TPR) repeat protein
VADEIINRCARLPLALTIVAAHAAARPTFPLATLAAQLRDETTRLDVLASDGPATDARAVFSWSYQALSPEAARLFRLLGHCLGPDISAAAAASLASSSIPHTRWQMAELCDAHLLTEHSPDRYAFHDLLRTYANELAHIHDDAVERRTALHRLLDHYLHTGYAAARALNPHRQPITIAPAQPGVTPESVADYEQALAWYTAEHSVLLALVEQAAAAGFDNHVWQFAWATTDFLYRRGYWHDWLATQHAALEAAQRLADQSAQAMAHLFLGMAYAQMGRYADADPHLQTALDLYQRLDDPVGEAQTRINLGAHLSRQDRYAEALHHCRRALEIFVATGNRLGQAQTLNAIGWYHAQLGDHDAALSHCQRALALQQELGDRNSEASTWDSLGYVHHRLGNHQEAVTCYRRAIDLYEQLGIRYYQAVALIHLGDANQTAGDLDRTRTVWQQALGILEELDHPEADRVRAKLRAVAATTGGSTP